jgi:hypothetical protein
VEDGSTTDGLGGPTRAGRIGYLITMVLFGAIPLAAIVEHIAEVPVYGVLSTTTSGNDGRLHVVVHYPRVARPGLAAPFEIRMHRDGGFAGPVTVGIDAEYVAIWDENGRLPAPASESLEDNGIVWEFDPPDGDVLHARWDGRIEPAVSSGRDGEVWVDDGSGDFVRISFRTEIRP